VRDTDPDREFNYYIDRFRKAEEERIRKRYPLPLDDAALARAQVDVASLNGRIAAMRAYRADIIARAQQAIENATDPKHKAALTDLLDLYRRNPTADDGSHQEADDLLLNLIDDKMVTELFNALPKWYA